MSAIFTQEFCQRQIRFALRNQKPQGTVCSLAAAVIQSGKIATMIEALCAMYNGSEQQEHKDLLIDVHGRVLRIWPNIIAADGNTAVISDLALSLQEEAEPAGAPVEFQNWTPPAERRSNLLFQVQARNAIENEQMLMSIERYARQQRKVPYLLHALAVVQTEIRHNGGIPENDKQRFEDLLRESPKNYGS